jgi:hypothetical protein
LTVLHKNRAHYIKDYDDVDALVEMLTKHDWVGCAGFRWKRLALLHDDGGEYVVVRDGHEVESLTVGWFEPAKLRALLVKLERGEEGSDYGTVEVRPHPPGACYLCA